MFFLIKYPKTSTFQFYVLVFYWQMGDDKGKILLEGWVMSNVDDFAS